MRIDQVILGLFQDKKIEKIYYKNYKIFDYDENKINKPCYLEFPLNINKNEIISQVFYRNGIVNIGIINKLEFIYYEDFNARFGEYHAEEYVIDLLHFKNTKNTFEDYFLNDEKTVYFQLTHQRGRGYNVYIIGLTKNIVIKNNHLDFQPSKTDIRGINIRGINGYFKYIKFNDVLHLENPNESVDLSYCFNENTQLRKIEDFEKIGITKVSNLENFCSANFDLESGFNLFFQNLTTSYVKSLKQAFYNCHNLTDTILLQNIHLSNDCDSDALDYTFQNCWNINFNSSQIRHFDFTKLTQLNYTFDNCRFTENNNIINFSNLDFSNIISLNYFLNPRYINTEETRNYIDFSNSLFPDVEYLSGSFANLGKQNNFLNVSFPKAKEMRDTFKYTTPINFDLDASIFNNNNIEDLWECFCGSDLTDYDMNTILQKVLNLPSSVNKRYMFITAKIDNLNFNNTIFEYEVTHQLKYTTEHGQHSPVLMSNKYICPKYNYLFNYKLFYGATINTVYMNNCTFKEPIITTVTEIVKDTWYPVPVPEPELPYFNYLNILLYNSHINTLNMNNCIFGEHMIPSFWCNVNNINLNNPQPYNVGQELLCDRYIVENFYGVTSIFQSKIIQIEQWIENIFNNNTLSSISFQGFVFSNNNLFGPIHVAKGTNQIKWTGLFNSFLKRVDLSASNIREIYLEELYGSIDYEGVYHEYTRRCELTELILNYLPTNFIGDNSKVYASKMNLANNTFYYNDFLSLIGGSYNILQDLNISDVTLNAGYDPDFSIRWLRGENINDTNLTINFNCPIETLDIKYCKLNHLNLNTVLNGQILNNINVLEGLSINESEVIDITLFNTNKMNFDDKGLKLEKNENLEEIHFIDNNSFICTQLSLTGCKSLTTNTLHNIFQHMDCRGNRPTLTFSLSECTSLTTCDFSNLKYIRSNPIMSPGFEGLFKYDNNLTMVNFNNIKIQDGVEMFQGCSSLKNILNMDFDGYISGTLMFDGCSSLTTVPAIPADGSSSISIYSDNLYGMFRECSSLTSIDVSRFNMSNIKNISQMFTGCSSLTSIDVSNWNTHNLEDISFMFEGCSSLTSIDVSNWDATNLISTICMFDRCSSLTNIQLFSFPTIDITKRYNFFAMFRECSSLINLNLKNFHCYIYGRSGNEPYGTKISNMFYDCAKLETIYTDNNDDSIIDLDSITEESLWNSTNVFHGCVNLVGGMGTSYIDTQTTMDAKFAQADKSSEKQGYFTYQSTN